MPECTCGNPEMGFDCVCSFVASHPGNRSFCCEFCGIYEASEPRCNKCDEWQPAKKPAKKYWRVDGSDCSCGDGDCQTCFPVQKD